MKIGLVGLSQSGKTTLFNALTGSSASLTSFGADKAEQNIAVVKVGDERVTRLSDLYKPKKTIYASIDLVDFGSMAEETNKQEALESNLMRLIRNTDAIALVVRGFENEYLPAPRPLADLEKIVQDFYLSDQVIVESRLEKIEAGYKRGQKTPLLQTEEKLLRRILEQLEATKPVSALEFNADEERIIRGFQFLTKKPLLAILNSDEAGFGKQAKILTDIGARYEVLEFAGKFEMELSQMNSDDATMFMADIGITESARDRLTHVLYGMLGYISFFTVGEDEVRAWTLRANSTAPEAAGAIHTDLARGFIRAECFAYSDLIALGSEKAVKEKGKLRLEGKEYIVKDGDILNIRFNV
jgi:GTP-binding protein YchF